MDSFFLLILACAVSMLVIPVAMRAAPGLGLIDAPDPRKVHKIPVPRVGGWGIALGTLAPLLLMFGLDPLLQSFVIGVVVLFLFGVWDDARELGHWPKFVGQGVAVLVVVLHGGLHVTRLPFLDDVVIPELAGQAFTAFAMIGAINAINHSDGLDGLAGGESVLSLLAIAFLGYAAGSPLDTAIALATIGGTFGFLRYNTHPARVFMGDCGSQVLGFALAFLVIHLSQVANPAMSPMVPVLLLGLPIADILVVLYKRAAGGMNWFKATRNHVHHRLLDLGFTHFESVVCIYLLQATLILAGVLLQYDSDHVLATIYLAVMLLLFGTLSFAERRSLRRGARAAGPVAALLGSAQQSTRLRSLTLGFIAMLVPLLLLLPAGWVSDVPRDIGVLSVLAALLLLGGLVMYGEVAVRVSQWLIRAITYVGVACAVYVFTQYPGAGKEQVLWSANVLVAALAVAIGLFVRFLGEQRFSTTPTDYLVALGLIVLAAMDRSRVIEDSMVRFVTYAVVMFYGCEVIIDNLPRWRHALGLPTLAALALLGLRGLA